MTAYRLANKELWIRDQGHNKKHVNVLYKLRQFNQLLRDVVNISEYEVPGASFYQKTIVNLLWPLDDNQTVTQTKLGQLGISE